MKFKDKNIGSLYTVAVALLICLAAFCPVNIQDALSIVAAGVLGPQGAGAVGIFIVLGMAGVPVLPAGPGSTAVAFGGTAGTGGGVSLSGLAGLGGTAALTGPNGGFIWGIFLAALLCGLLMGNVLKKKEPVGLLERAEAAAKARKTDWFYLVKLLLVLVASWVVIQACGLIWFAKVMSQENLAAGKLAITYADAFMLCTVRNIPFLVIKIAASYSLILILRKLLAPKRG